MRFNRTEEISGSKSLAGFETAAAIVVITAEDIRRSGATNIPDLLRMGCGPNQHE
jgi:outer membrane cobalamin receptor